MTEQELCAAAIYHCLMCKMTSLHSFLAALHDYYSNNGLGTLPRGELYRKCMRGLENTFGLTDHVIQKKAFTMGDLSSIHTHILHTHTFEHARDWCMLTLAFFGCLRIGEYCDGGLRMADVFLYSWGILLRIPFSKTTTQPTDVRIAARGDNDRLCPARALRSYITHLGPNLLRSPTCPFFLRFPTLPLSVTAGTFTHRIQHLVTIALGRDGAAYGGHSLRRGGATALYMAGVQEAVIQQHGRWRSAAVRKYLEASAYHQLVPTATLLEKTAGAFPLHQASSSSPSYSPAAQPLISSTSASNASTSSPQVARRQ